MNPWILLLLPIVATAVLLIGFRHKVVWWEIALQYVVTVIMISFCNFIAVESQVSDTEYWGGYVQRVEHYDPWNEYIHRRCTRSCGKNCHTTYDCSYVRYHAEEWVAVTTLGNFNITKAHYNKLAIKFGGVEIFKELNRHYYTKDGDMHFVKWPETNATLEDVTEAFHYRNKPKAALNVFRFERLDSTEKKLYKPFNYPEIVETFKQKQLLGWKDPIAEHELNVLNAKLDAKKKVRVYICVFEKQPREAGFAQERFWEGGNKNEFVINIGTDGTGVITWVHVFSWTHSEDTKVDVRHYVEGLTNISTENLIHAVRYTWSELDKKYTYNDFKEFDYLSIYPTTGQLCWIAFCVLLINIGSGIWIVKNEIE